MNEYPEDEFDRLAKDRATQGAHRRPGYKHAWLFALLAVIIIAPLLGIWLGNVYSNSGNTASDTPTPTATSQDASESASPTDGASPTDASPSADATESQTADETTPAESSAAETTPAAEVNHAAQVLLLNGRGSAGFAAENQAVLQGAAYTNVTTGDYAGGASPATTTVYYASADFAATAQDIATQLGGAELVESAQAVAGNEIVVVLR